MSKTNIKAVIWDLDGTLIHFKIDWLRARREALKILRNHGVPKSLLTARNSILDNVEKAKEYFKSIKLDPEEVISIFKLVESSVNEIEYEAALNATPIDGIKKVLDFVKSRNLKQAIYTFNTTKNAEISLDKVEFLSYFDVIVGRDQVENAKPHPEHLSTICEKLNVNCQETIVIGDTSRDIEGAMNVQANSIALKTKLSNFSNIRVLQKADVLVKEIDVPEKLIKAIKGFL
ncbi:MAG: HAD-IA family hydrolase [Candidatus Lokiarchaeota archaeon]|nr:HAD-IA family hydrolase [Candidatus Lokiarchaeota archaeon]